MYWKREVLNPSEKLFDGEGERMRKHLLVTVSEQSRYLHGVRFVESFFRDKSAVKVTLFYVAPRIDAPKGTTDLAQRQMNMKTNEIYMKRGQEALDRGCELLIRRGFPPEQVLCRLIAKQFGTVKDIAREGRLGAYDAVVLGRRGYTVFESVLSDSVTKAMMGHDVDFPLWICRQPEQGRRNVLLCVDGSESSLRAADHVGFMVEKEKDHAVAIFHVDTGHGMSVESIVDEAWNKLRENGVEEERISSSVARSSRAVKTILDEVERKRYAAVAVGRVGVQKGRLKEWMVGSRSMKLLESMEKAALWVSR